MRLNDEKKKSKKIHLFRNPSRTRIVTFSLGQKGCDYLGKCDYRTWIKLSRL